MFTITKVLLSIAYILAILLMDFPSIALLSYSNKHDWKLTPLLKGKWI